LSRLMAEAGDSLCLSEGPGAGKTTFTRRLQAFLSGERAQGELAQGAPLLALRWEESAAGNDREWPTDFHAAIEARVAADCKTASNEVTADEVAKYALRNGLVVLILDALDQVTEPARVIAFQTFLKEARENEWRVRVVLTGRTFAVDAIKQQLATAGDWRFGAILPFDIRRQHAYLHGPVHEPDSTDPRRKRRIDESKVKRLVGAVTSARGNDEFVDDDDIFKNTLDGTFSRSIPMSRNCLATPIRCTWFASWRRTVRSEISKTAVNCTARPVVLCCVARPRDCVNGRRMRPPSVRRSMQCCWKMSVDGRLCWQRRRSP